MADIMGSLLLATFDSVKELISGSGEKGGLRTLGFVFKLHANITFTMLLLCSGLLQLVKVSLYQCFRPSERGLVCSAPWGLS